MLLSDLRASYDSNMKFPKDLQGSSRNVFKAEPIESYFQIKATVNQALNLDLKPRLNCLIGRNAGESIPLTTTDIVDVIGKGELTRV
jgi:hypothetical protein